MKSKITTLFWLFTVSFCVYASSVDITGHWQHTEKDAVISFDLESGRAWVKSHADNNAAEGLNVIKQIAPAGEINRWQGQMFDGYKGHYVEVTLHFQNGLLTVADAQGTVVLTLKKQQKG